VDFGGKSAVVTGAGGGIGAAIATALVGAGATVVAVDLKPAPAEIEGATWVAADVTSAAAPREILAALPEGGLDFLVNAAGIGLFGRDGEVETMDDALWDKVLAINLTAPMRLARAAIPRMADGGAMVHVASIIGLRGADDPMTAYQVSKAGLVSLSRGLAMQLAGRRIRSNTICPGAIETPMLAGIYDEDPARRTRMIDRTPLRRMGRPEDIAAACLYLLGDEASFVTGTDLVVDGGWLSILP
jgi:NAD(P)-dependent dehydrogenase (short-subunit alcohol dehydrogenase family)